MFLINKVLPLFGMVCLFAGCGGDDGRRPTAPVTVTVKHKGKPVEGATVQFVSVEDPLPAVGTTDSNGTCSLTTYEANDGAIIGNNVVMIAKTEVDNDNVREVAPEDRDLIGVVPPPTLKNLIPGKYALPGSSGLKEEVKDGENTFTFDLK